MKKILIIYVYTVFSFLFGFSLEFYNNSYAVIIGINNYASDDVPDLGYAVEDAESIANLLITKLGYNEENIHLLLNEDATLINIKNTLYQIAIEAGKNDRILVFYGGHGETMPLPSGGELGYLLPVDGKRENLYTSGLSMQEFKQISEFTPAKHVLYLVDVCYGGIMTVATRSLAKNDFNDDVLIDGHAMSLSSLNPGDSMVVIMNLKYELEWDNDYFRGYYINLEDSVTIVELTGDDYHDHEEFIPFTIPDDHVDGYLSFHLDLDETIDYRGVDINKIQVIQGV